MSWTRALLEHPYPAIQWGTVLGASLVATCSDLRTRRIPNALTLPLFAAGIAQAAMFRGWTGLLDSLVASCVLALPYVLLFALAEGGAGDAKLMGAIGAWLGLFKGGLTLAFVSLSGVALALLVAHTRKDLRRVSQWLSTTVQSLALRVSLHRLPTRADLEPSGSPESSKMAYGPAIGLGALFACTSWYVWHV